MLLFNNDYNRYPFQEVLINGREPEQDENERPTDYTAEEDTEDTGNPPAAAEPPAPNNPAASAEDNTNPVDNPEDYTVPDDAEGDNPPGGGGAATDNTPNTGEGLGAATTDYTADTGATPAPAAATAAANAPDAGADPAPPAADAAAEGGGDEGGGMEGEGAPTDYTAGGGGEEGEGEGGGDPNAGGGEEGAEGGGMEGGAEGGGDMGAEGGGDEGGSDYDYGSDDSGGSSDGYDQQIQDLEKDIYSDLNEPQMDIRNRELKQNFVNLYNMVGDITERINDISKDTASMKPLEFAASKLNKLSDTISDYLTTTFSTKSYMENDINYHLFLKTVEDINTILASIGRKS